MIERPESIKFEELEGFDRNQYQKYRRLFTQQYRRPYSYNLPFVPNMFVPKTAVVNFQEVISYFKSLYTAEAAKSEKS
nr:hypothetical protein [Candidatus Mycoplasma haematolamae]